MSETRVLKPKWMTINLSENQCFQFINFKSIEKLEKLEKYAIDRKPVCHYIHTAICMLP